MMAGREALSLRLRRLWAEHLPGDSRELMLERGGGELASPYRVSMPNHSAREATSIDFLTRLLSTSLPLHGAG